jgi:hypothetical protein
MRQHNTYIDKHKKEEQFNGIVQWQYEKLHAIFR